jgi:hypothetical protein
MERERLAEERLADARRASRRLEEEAGAAQSATERFRRGELDELRGRWAQDARLSALLGEADYALEAASRQLRLSAGERLGRLAAQAAEAGRALDVARSGAGRGEGGWHPCG